MPSSAIEWGTDSTRSIANLIFSGTSQKYRDINWIFSHGGGALTSFAERFLVQMTSTPPYKDKFTRESVQAELNRFYYDTAQVTMHRSTKAEVEQRRPDLYDIVAAMEPMTVRQVFYQATVRGLVEKAESGYTDREMPPRAPSRHLGFEPANPSASYLIGIP